MKLLTFASIVPDDHLNAINRNTRRPGIAILAPGGLIIPLPGKVATTRRRNTIRNDLILGRRIDIAPDEVDGSVYPRCLS
jgi:hypothetical protein